MKRYAWIETIGKLQVVKDVCIGNPYDVFPADVAKFYSEEVPDGVINGAIFDPVREQWVNPPEEKPSIFDAPVIKTEVLKEYLSKLNITTATEDVQAIISLINNNRVAAINNQDGFLKQIFTDEKESI